MAFTSTPSPKQNILLDSAVSSHRLSLSFSILNNTLKQISRATVHEFAESKAARASVFFTKLDIFKLESFVNVWKHEITLNKRKMYLVWIDNSVNIISRTKISTVSCKILKQITFETMHYLTLSVNGICFISSVNFLFPATSVPI